MLDYGNDFEDFDFILLTCLITLTSQLMTSGFSKYVLVIRLTMTYAEIMGRRYYSCPIFWKRGGDLFCPCIWTFKRF
jgi:hypothetical protein